LAITSRRKSWAAPRVSSSALGTILLAAVLVLYWAYDRIVGIDNVKLG